jgi:hypothetical protein
LTGFTRIERLVPVALGVLSIGGKILSVYMSNHGFTYIRIGELPQAEQQPFQAWMAHQTRPLLDGAEDACYAWDYERWQRVQRGVKVMWD